VNDTDAPEPHDASLLVAVTAHFSFKRLEYLGEVLHALAQFPVRRLDVVLVTNTTDQAELALLQQLSAEALPGRSVSIESFEFLGHPFNLTWSHKDIIRREFGGRADAYTHFVYLEDDIRFTYANFRYFCANREMLRPFGLLPSFLRIEFQREPGAFVSSDMKQPVHAPSQPLIQREGVIWLNMPNPYVASYVLDRELMEEFMAAPSFSRGASRELTDWDVRERAAMGLCYDNVPAGFESRYVVPVSCETGMALPASWIGHVPSNYANDPRSGFGKIRLASLFEDVVGNDALAVRGALAVPRAVVRRHRSRWARRDWYLYFPRLVIERLRWWLGARR
jgi:hypothetical protein